MEILLAIIAALMFSLGTVLQQKVAAEVPDEDTMKAGLLLQLARRPVWLLGIVVDGLGFLCQAAALHFGKLVVVQPLLAISVVFALPLGRWITNRRITKNDVIGAGAVTGGLILFLVLADPQGGVKDASTAGWIISGAIAGAICLALITASRGRPPSPKAALLGMSAGILFGFSAGLTLTVVDDLDNGFTQIVTDWHLYALIAVGWISMTLSQASLQTGALAPAISTQMSLDPIASVVLGIVIFKERIDDTPLEGAIAAIGLAVMIFGLVILARSQALGESAAKPATEAA
ncbi:MAG: DMT family transporter [Thermoleophilia bacterium]|nr:DMT family transporter [Thermoleophilia bacterium]